MAGFSTGNNEHLIRSNLWSSQIKDVLEDELHGMKYVRMITDFPDGDTLNIPSIGQAEVLDYAEGQGVKYTAMDTGNFTFSINKYKSSATYITEKMKQDSFYMSELMSMFVPKQSRAIAEAMENDIMNIGPDGQTTANPNTINGAHHRFAGGGTGEVIVPQDFQKARFALQKANVPLVNLVAIIDPSAEYALATMTNLVTLQNNPKWEGVVREGASTGMHFLFNVYGFDVYVSNHLKVNTASETISGTAVAAGVNNLFFSAAADVLPFVGNVRQPPKVDSEFNKDYQREEYLTTARWGFKLFRPENLVVVVTDTDQV